MAWCIRSGRINSEKSLTVSQSRGIFALAVVRKIQIPQFTSIMKIQTLTPILAGLFFALFASGTAQKLNDVHSFERHVQRSAFVENKGQWNAAAGYMAQFPGMNMWITPTGFVMDASMTAVQNSEQMRDKFSRKSSSNDGSTVGQVVQVSFAGAQPARLRGESALDGMHSYLIGNNPAHWAVNVHRYASLMMEELYPSINTRLYARDGAFRYDVICAPKSDVSAVRLQLRGASGLSLSATGDVKIATQIGALIMGKPLAYQIINGKKTIVECTYTLSNDDSMIGFALGAYNSEYELVIDPPVFSTFLGGNQDDMSKAITVDTNKSAYITGETTSPNFPTTPGAYKKSSLSKDSFVSKFTPSGTGLVYSTYIGGDGGTDVSTGIAVDGLGNAFLTGFTSSKDFPTTDGSKVKNLDAGSDAFVIKLKPDGTGFVYSTLIGGRNDDFSNSIVINPAGEAVF